MLTQDFTQLLQSETNMQRQIIWSKSKVQIMQLTQQQIFAWNMFVLISTRSEWLT